MNEKKPWHESSNAKLLSCPDCGNIHIIPIPVEESMCRGKKIESVPFDCNRCHTHYTAIEFYRLNNDKWSESMQEDPICDED